jgi:hypothetical protein
MQPNRGTIACISQQIHSSTTSAARVLSAPAALCSQGLLPAARLYYSHCLAVSLQPRTCTHCIVKLNLCSQAFIIHETLLPPLRHSVAPVPLQPDLLRYIHLSLVTALSLPNPVSSLGGQTSRHRIPFSFHVYNLYSSFFGAVNSRNFLTGQSFFQCPC